MLLLIVIFLIGLEVAYFAIQNTRTVTITFMNYPFSGIPLYIVVIGSLMVGVFLSWIVSIIGSISSSLTIRGKNIQLSDATKEIKNLEKHVHNLEVENAHLKGEHFTSDEEKKEVSTPHIGLLDRLRLRF